jgi:peptidoglycan/xylan/chitin deacetylase (PgdA/CDA1 family)
MSKGKLYTLMFHGVVDTLPKYSIFDESKNCFVTTHDFEKIIKYCSKNFNVIRQSEITEYINSKSDTHAILITFDDGLESVFSHALPILRKYNVPATVFITSGWIDSMKSPAIFNIETIIFNNLPINLTINKDNFNKIYHFKNRRSINHNLNLIWSDLFKSRISPLSLDDSNFEFDKYNLHLNSFMTNTLWLPASWDQIKSAVKTNLIELGIHGDTHKPWNWMNKLELEEEVNISKLKIKNKTGYICNVASFPHGMYSLENLKVLDNYFTYFFANNMNKLTLDDKLIGRVLVPFGSPNSITALIYFKNITLIIHYIKNKLKKYL